MVCLDVDTRWNSTFMMLEVATIYQSAFERLYIEDYNYEAFFKINKDEVEGGDNKNKKKKKEATLDDLIKELINYHMVSFVVQEVSLVVHGTKYQVPFPCRAEPLTTPN
ncbi:hypothetical protein POM88_039598 [Heracleum sosnowskyi]|uniref:Uncharacterized protein n=1 Tax=Heracleum sosnowskyi TaxID=360622 RepID=A0AAD8M8Y9_9APIA|nr:hypothetical protein POM88_039598 [Heracleum sosnowskyi]